jgi:hypothetical protein
MVSPQPLSKPFGRAEKLWFHRLSRGRMAGKPFGPEVGTGEPLNRLHERVERARHKREVNLR